MKKGQMCEGIVEKVKFPNKGIVKVEDSEVTVKNTRTAFDIKTIISLFICGKISIKQTIGNFLQFCEHSVKQKSTV